MKEVGNIFVRTLNPAWSPIRSRAASGSAVQMLPSAGPVVGLRRADASGGVVRGPSSGIPPGGGPPGPRRRSTGPSRRWPPGPPGGGPPVSPVVSTRPTTRPSAATRPIRRCSLWQALHEFLS